MPDESIAVCVTSVTPIPKVLSGGQSLVDVTAPQLSDTVSGPINGEKATSEFSPTGKVTGSATHVMTGS